MKKRRMIKSDYICPKCGSVTPVSRENATKRMELLLWCYECREHLRQIEVRDSEVYFHSLQFKTDLTEQEENLKLLLSNRRIAN